jgi:aryl-alcohol dehydrogenase-like predicted oxidoreductase
MPTEIPPALQASFDVSKCEYKRLGNSGLKVSVPILGAMSFGTPKWQDWVLDEEKSLPLIKAAWDRGLTTFDTSNNYSAGHSELIIGKALKHYRIPRHKILIFTKCYGTVGEEPDLPVMEYAKEVKASRDYVNQQGMPLK